LLHNTIYVPGQARFNESFAVFVGSVGAANFFAARGDSVRAERAEALWADEVTFSAFLTRVIADLETAYAAGIQPVDRDARLAAAQQAYARELWRTRRYEEFAHEPLNNARLLHYQLYADRLARFDALYRRLNQDLPAAINWVRDAARRADDPFVLLEQELGTDQSSIVSSRRNP
jgi:predicted aminopeptidase